MKRSRHVASLLLALLCAACGRAAPKPPGQLRIAQLTSCVTLDPHRHDSYYTNVTLGHFYDRLVNFGPNLELVPELALNWENPSETVWRLHLRSGVVFHDGRPFGAEDVAASLRRAQGSDSHLKHYVQRVRDVKVVDPLTVDLVTSGPAPVLLNDLAFVMIVPRETGAPAITHPVGTGPYRFVSGSAGATVTGSRFDRYWGTGPAFDSFAVLPMPDAADREHAIAGGHADVIAQFPPDGWQRARQEKGIQLLSKPGLGVDYLSFSFVKGSPWLDRRAREAVALALDRDALVKAAYGLAVPAWQLVPPTVFGYAQDVPHPPRDVVRARELLAAAGFGKGLSSRLIVAQRAEATAREVARQLAEIGVTLQAEVLSQNDFYERRLHPESALAIDSYIAATGDAGNFLDAELHSRNEGLGTFSANDYRNPRLDALIDRAAGLLEARARNDALQDAMRLVADDLPLVPLLNRFDLYAVRAGLAWKARHVRLTAADFFPAP